MTDSPVPESTDQTGSTSAASTPNGMTQSFHLHQFPEKLAVVRLPAGAEIPPWAESSSLFSITATATETSLVCAGRDVPTKQVARKGLTAFAVEGPIDPDLIGVLATLLVPLADAGVGVFTISTFDTDWILVAVKDAEAAAEAWRARGHTVTLAVPAPPVRKNKK